MDDPRRVNDDERELFTGISAALKAQLGGSERGAKDAIFILQGLVDERGAETVLPWSIMVSAAVLKDLYARLPGLEPHEHLQEILFNNQPGGAD